MFDRKTMGQVFTEVDGAAQRPRAAFGRRGVFRSLLGLAGVAGLIRPRAALATTDAEQKWICSNSECRPYIYDPRRGDPTQDIPPGTAFEDLPDDWYCPDCGAAKVEFIRYRG